MIEYRDVTADRVRTGKLRVMHVDAGGITKAFEFGLASTPDTTAAIEAATALTGAGLCPVGASSAGIGSLATSAAPSVVRKAPRAVLIDKNTKDIVLDDAGYEMETTPTDQRVYILLNTVRGSRRIDKQMGFQRPLRMTASIESETRDLVKQALMPAIEDHSIELLSVTTFYG
jgi:hypothetical protein